MGVASVSNFLFSACQKADSNLSAKSSEQDSRKTDSSSSIRVSQTNMSSITWENEENQADQKKDIQNSLTNEELAIVLSLSPNIQISRISQLMQQFPIISMLMKKIQAMILKIQLSKRLLPDIIVSFSSMGSTQRFHFDEDLITVISYSNYGDESEERFSKKELINEFGEYQEQLAALARKAEYYSPVDEHSEKAEDNSDMTVDTKNLTSQQFKDWVSAVLDKQFTLGRSSFPYELFIENHEGYAYVRVKHNELQVDTITMFSINSEGQLEEEDKSNGYPVSYKVISSSFMDTSDVTLID